MLMFGPEYLSCVFTFLRSKQVGWGMEGGGGLGSVACVHTFVPSCCVRFWLQIASKRVFLKVTHNVY